MNKQIINRSSRSVTVFDTSNFKTIRSAISLEKQNMILMVMTLNPLQWR